MVREKTSSLYFGNITGSSVEDGMEGRGKD